MVKGRLWIIVSLEVGSALPEGPSIVKLAFAFTTALVLATTLRVITHLFYMIGTLECLSQQSRDNS